MKFQLIFLLIACAICSTNFYIYDIEYHHRYLLDTLNKISIGTYYFRIPVENLKETTIEIQTKQDDIANFKVKVCGFYQRPTDSEILNGTDSIELENHSRNKEDNYNYYKFEVPTLKKEEKIKYLVITLLNNEVLNYLSVYAYPSKAENAHDEAMSLYNITYMKEEIFNKTNQIQKTGIFIFISENGDIGKNKLIRLKFKKQYSPEIKIGVAGFKERPITKKELDNDVVSEKGIPLRSLTRDGNYTIYEFPIENPEIIKQKYIGFAVFMDESFDFISFYIGPDS
jgi:hypothetical protein